MADRLKNLTLKGFKSIEALEDFELNRLNVLIGANGAGKTNFVSFFRMLRALADEGFQKWVLQQGGGDGLFYLGPQHTKKIEAELTFGHNQYRFSLEPAADSKIIIGKEELIFTGGRGEGNWQVVGAGNAESVLKSKKDSPSFFGARYGMEHHVHGSLSSWVIYHFHDTSMTASMRRKQSVRDWRQLRSDASNIAAFLFHLQKSEKATYELIRDSIRLIAPFFDDFLLEPEERGDEEKIRLEWRQKGSDFPFQPYQLSDGMIRYICLTTALMQPMPPATIVIDEPELGLHPFAISLLAELIQSAAEKTQVIISTQSPTLLDCFEPADIVVVNRERGQSTFRRLDETDLTSWLEEYSVGELWQKNVVHGGPAYE